MATSISVQTLLVPHRHVVSATHADDTVLLDVATAQYYTLNAVGGEIWTALCDGQSLSAIVGNLAERFHKPDVEIQGDVIRLAEQLREAGLVDVRQ
jgi:hypothetical protein